MKKDIVEFCKKVCKKFGMQALYVPDNDTYFLHLRGRAVQSFDTKRFYQVPPWAREMMYLPLIKVGLALNLEGSHNASLFVNYKHGIRIV